MSLDLEVIKARLVNELPGPWERTEKDKKFIAAAPTDIAALIAEVERLRVEVQGLDDHLHKRWDKDWD